MKGAARPLIHYYSGRGHISESNDQFKVIREVIKVIHLALTQA